MHASIRRIPFIAFLTSMAVPCRAQCLDWDERFFITGTSSIVSALAGFDDGTGPALYAGGGFTTAGETTVNRIAKCDGATWFPLGSGVGGFGLGALTVFDDGGGPALYAGGSFTSASGVLVNHIAKWDGSSWSALGSGMGSDQVDALAVFDDGGGPALYAGGDFFTAGGASALRIAKWDGASWSPLGAGMNGDVYTLAVFDDGGGPALYAGGFFTTAGGLPANRVAKWDGSSWSPLGSGVDASVLALAVFDDGGGPALYAGGQFTIAGGGSASRIAKWDGSIWSALGSGANNNVRALTVFDDGGGSALYVGGQFTLAGGITAGRIAKWDGSSWWNVGGGFDNFVSALMAFDDGEGPALYAGGAFATAGGTVVNRVARWRGSAWSPVDAGMGVSGFPSSEPRVLATAVHDDGSGSELYAGGKFTHAGGTSATYIASWDGTSWSSVGGGMNDSTWALAEFDDGGGPALYAGGFFTSAGGASATTYLAKWDGSSWSSVGGGVNSHVYALAVFDDGGGPALYAAGVFSFAGAVSALHIARWDGANWSPLGGGINNVVYALAVFDDGAGPALYAAGGFTQAGGVTANRVAKWDGSAWSALDSGLSDWARTLCVFDDGGGPALYAGGNFTVAGGVSAERIARWDGAGWSAVGSGLGGFPPYVLASSVFDDGFGSRLYVGGSFFSVGGVAAKNIAKWDGTAWSAVGAGVHGDVSALGSFDDGRDGAPDLYVGGLFTLPSLQAASAMEMWHGCEPGTPGCFGDGLDPVQTVECPCGNIGEPGHGCTAFPPSLGGARLFATGSVNPNTVVLRCEDVVNNTLCTFLRSFDNNATGLEFGDGVRCVDPPLLRFGQQNSGQTGNAPFTVAVPAPTEIPGSTLHYLVQYRNPTGGWCTPALFNASNGYTIVW